MGNRPFAERATDTLRLVKNSVWAWFWSLGAASAKAVTASGWYPGALPNWVWYWGSWVLLAVSLSGLAVTVYREWSRTAPDGSGARGNLDVDLRLAMWPDATLINVHNNEDTDQFTGEVVAFGKERPLSRTHFPWKVKWEDHDSRFCAIAAGTSERLFLAKIERHEHESAFPGEPHPRKGVKLLFETPDGQKCKTAFNYLDAESFEMRRYFLHLLVSAKNQSKTVVRILELRLIHSMEDDFEKRAVIQKPILRARFVD